MEKTNRSKPRKRLGPYGKKKLIIDVNDVKMHGIEEGDGLVRI